MNNKGQVLVIFVILIPIIILFMIFIVSLGLLNYEKKSIEKSTIESINFYIENKDKEDVLNNTNKLLRKNIKDCDIDIKVNDYYIEISVKKKAKILFKENNINIKYKGYFESKEIIKG